MHFRWHFRYACQVLFYTSYQSIVTSVSCIMSIILKLLQTSRWKSPSSGLLLLPLFGLHLTHCLEQNMTWRNSQKFVFMSAYTGTSLTAAVILNVALLKSVRQKTRNLSIQQSFDSKFSKTIADCGYYGCLSYTINDRFKYCCIRIYQFPEKTNIKNREIDLLFTAIPCQVNAVLNSVIYLTRCSRMKSYYYRLFNVRADMRHLKDTVASLLNLAWDSNEEQHIDSI